jgi:hypothetical protein
MTSNPTSAYSMASGTTPAGLRLVTVQLADPGDADGRDHLLTEGVVDLVRHLVEATEDGTAPAAVDLRVEEADSRRPVVEAFVEAARGLVQSYVLENQQAIGPVNVVVSHATQEGDRQVTWSYLAAETGSFSRGATYDLREATA